ncbi:MAG: fibronectin type III domain-containing protein [Elusimicrobia bacterium]|nr:fibronectin type III domain-containing protein [Elusimicrobiota bacterium]
MPFKKSRALYLFLPLLLLFPWNAPAAGPRVNKASQRNLRLASPVAAVVSDLSAAALSTTSIQWYWSTGSYTGIDGFYLYSSSTAVKITLSSSTALYTDAGLGADTAYTRWITAYQGADEGADSQHMQKFTYALPPPEIAISSDAPVAAPTVNPLNLPWARRTDTIVSTSAYAEIPPAYWFPNPVHAGAYAMECSTDAGATYVRNRTFFVPWETFPVLSNKHYMVRMGAVNGDDELTPGIYSATRTFTTPPLTPSSFTAVAISSFSIQWRWDKDLFAGTGITGFNVYHSTLTAEDSLPAVRDPGVSLAALGPNTSYWTEVYVDSDTLAANSRHTRWLTAAGFLESEKGPVRQKYTYATAPATTTAVWLDPDPYWIAHVGEETLSLHWPTQGASTAIFSGDWRPAIASQYQIDYSTTAGFTVAVSSKITGGPPQAVTGLTNNTKYDLRIGAINGDGEQTPENAQNPFAYSQFYRVMTRPVPPNDFAGSPWTDTAMNCTWSTAAYTHPEYIEGYMIGKRNLNPDGSVYWNPLDTLTGAASNQYYLDYLMTNSTHTLDIWVTQQDPDWVAGNPHFDAVPKHWEYYYNNYGSNGRTDDGYTFATPPNDVDFSTRAPHSLSLAWEEPEVPATKYRVERSTTLGEKGPWVFIASATGNSYLDAGLDVSTAGLTAFTTYTYRVGAVNLLGIQTLDMSTHTSGHRRDYSYAESTMTVHGAPALYAVATGTTSIRWWWTDSYSGVTGYNLYTSTDGLLAGGLGAGATYYDEAGLSGANARYSRRARSVTAYDGEGDHGEASASTLVNAPASLAITSTGSYKMSLGWPAGEGVRYKLDRSTDGLNWTGLKSWSDVQVSTSLEVTGLRYAATYYFAVGAYNDDGAVSLSSAVTSGVTLPLPSIYTAVFATDAAKNVTAPLPGAGLITVTIPAGTPDGFFWLSTSAAAAPEDVSINDLNDATARLTDAILIPGNIVELHLFDVFGNVSTAALPSPARVAITYPDAADDGIVDGSPVKAGTLRLYDLDTAALLWNRLSNSTLNAGAKTVYADIPHFSFYALGGDDAADNFKGVALSTAGIQWRWPSVAGVDGYYLYSSSTPDIITVSSTASSYTDLGLRVNKAYTRWLAPYTGASTGAASQQITKYTHALPPAAFTLSSVTAVSAYLEWNFSTATAYAIEGSTDGGGSYYRIRDSFVPWQTVTLLSNKSYRIRIGAINGDNELSPGYYSSVAVTTTVPLDMTIASAVALSSYTIQWQWSTGTIAATGITGYRIYSSTGGVVYSTGSVDVSSWTETYTDGVTANSLRTRWIKAVGLLESPGYTGFSRYTYAIAPSTCGAASPDFKNVQTDYVNLDWKPRVAASEASKYIIYYATAGVAESSASFSVPLTSSIVSGAPSKVTGLAGNTKHDFRIGAINGDDQLTPDDALNPFAYSARYKVITKPVVPEHSCEAVTDNSLKWKWSTGTLTDASTTYLTGYYFAIASNTAALGDFWLELDFIPGISATQYIYAPAPPAEPYLLTNSSHTRALGLYQSWSPDCFSSPGDPACYYFFHSNAAGSSCSTFATPPNDVVFDTVAARSVGLWWKEPQIPATQYEVRRSTSVGEQGNWVFLSSVTGTHYQDTGLTPTTTYSYRIGAINRDGVLTAGLAAATDGNRRDYSFVSSTLTKHIAPILSGYATSTTSVNWSWTDLSPGVTVQAYNLYTSTEGLVAAGLSANTSFYVEVDLSSANARYTRWVRSVAWNGVGDYTEKAVSTLANPPGAPVMTSSGVHTLSLGWTDNGSSRYKLAHSLDKNNWTDLKSWSDVLVSTWFNDTGLRFASTYYYAVGGYNYDGILSVSSSVSAAYMTQPLPAAYTAVYTTAAAALNVTAPLTEPGLVTVTVAIPAGSPDGYFSVSTNAAASPVDISTASLAAAKTKLTSAALLDGSIIEMHMYDVSGSPVASGLTAPARITITYTDAGGDDIVDGTQYQVTSLRLFNLDTGALVWNQLANSALNKGARTVYADVPHFSFYSLGSVTSAVGTIADAFAYPNPYKPGSGGVFGESVYGEGIVFESLPARSKVKIYNLAGGLVRELSDDDGDGRCLWDARNKDGARAASGVYLFLATGPSGGKKSGRIAIIK